VFEEIWHRIPPAGLDQSILAHWENVRQFREVVTKRIEEKREQKQIGSSLAAELDIRTDGKAFESLTRMGEDLKFVLITSRASVARANGSPVAVEVKPSKHPKCERCWHYREDVGAAGLCGRCQSNLQGAGEARRYA